MWIQACKLDEGDLRTYTFICSRHFKVNDFCDGIWPKRKLLPSAVPSPLLNYDKNSSSKVNVEHCSPSTSKLSEVADADSSLIFKANANITNNQVLESSNLTRTFNNVCLNTPLPPNVPQILNTEVQEEQSGPDAAILAAMNIEETCGDIPDTQDNMHVAGVSCSESYSPHAIGSPRKGYIGDFRVEHFVTPRRAKRLLDMLNDSMKMQRKKLRTLQVQKQRLENRIEVFKDLLKHLFDNQLISEDIYSEMMTGTPQDIQHIQSTLLKEKK